MPRLILHPTALCPKRRTRLSIWRRRGTWRTHKLFWKLCLLEQHGVSTPRPVVGVVTVNGRLETKPLLDVSFIDHRTKFLNFSAVDLSSPFVNETNRAVLENLFEMHLSWCSIKNAQASFVSDITALATVYKLDLSHNHIARITNDSMLMFMSNLQILDLSHNTNLDIPTDDPHPPFSGLSKIKVIDLSHTGITSLHQIIVQGLTELQLFNLSNTPIANLQSHTFPFGFTLQTLDLRGCLIETFHIDALHGLVIEEKLYTNNFALCCHEVRGLGIPESKCEVTENGVALTPDSAISSCSDLVASELHSFLLRIIGLYSVVGNIFVLYFRLFGWDRSILKKPHGLLVTNLSVSDLIMGVYLALIAGADVYYRGEYAIHDSRWRGSDICKAAGFMSTLSSETSKFFIFLITVDRYLIIKFPFGEHKFTTIGVTISTIMAWVLGFTLALIPILPPFDHWTVYSSNAMCLGLPLTTKRLDGWGYSTAIFLFLNCILFICIVSGQWSIYSTMTDKRATTMASLQTSKRRSNDIDVAKQLSLVVISDFLCWFPIGIMGCLTLAGVEIGGEAYTWSAVVILPVNAALNPILYMLPVFKQMWGSWKKERLQKNPAKDQTSFRLSRAVVSSSSCLKDIQDSTSTTLCDKDESQSTNATPQIVVKKLE